MTVSRDQQQSSTTVLPTLPTSAATQIYGEYASRDFSNDIDKPVPGWPQLAWVMSKVPEFEAFQAFSDLNVKSLLYYQAELVHLREKLHKAEWRDFRSTDGDEADFSGDLRFLLLSRDDADKNSERPPEQWLLITQMRRILKEYSTFVVGFDLTFKHF